jgi:LmbE family N-acetylglucosaminyl deacetylase
MYNHPEHEWTVGYLTYTAQDPRGAELSAFWQRRGIDCVFLGFVDDWHDNEQQQLTRWHEVDAESACWKLAQQYDLVLTHDEHGDYGHIHHVVVHNAVKQHHNLVTFAKPGQGVTYTVPQQAYSIDELPMHGSIVSSFHSQEHKNSYKEKV